MKKMKITSGILATVGVLMISIALVLQSENSADVTYSSGVQEFDIKSMAAAVNVEVKDNKNDVSDTVESTDSTSGAVSSVTSLPLTEVIMEAAPASVIIPPRVEVYNGLTLEELAAKLDRNLGSGYIAGKGYLVASYCLQSGVDPYVAVAIMLHETGCSSNCSSLVRSCNNVGGQKGAPGCNGGAYKAYNTLDEGIIGFIDNLNRNYYSKGLNTIDAIGPRYAASTTWVSKIYAYVNKISAS